MFHLLLTFLSLMFSTSNPRSKASETSATAWCLGSVKPTDSLPVHQKSWRHDKTPRYFRRWRLTKPGCSIPWATVWNQGVQGQPVSPKFFAASTKIPSSSGLRTFGMLEFGSFSRSGESYRQHGRKNPLGKDWRSKKNDFLRVIRWIDGQGGLFKYQWNAIQKSPRQQRLST